MVVAILVGIGILLGWNRQLIASVHELRMTKAVRDRSVSDAEI